MSEYLLLICVLLTASVLMHVFGRPVFMIPAGLLVVPIIAEWLVLTAWDVVGLSLGHWYYPDESVIFKLMLGMPIEDQLVFLVTPYFCLVLHAVTGRWFGR